MAQNNLYQLSTLSGYKPLEKSGFSFGAPPDQQTQINVPGDFGIGGFQQDKMTMQGQINSLLRGNDATAGLLDIARAQGQQQTAGRGLINSSMGSQAGANALIQSAIPIAQYDAGILSQFGLQQANNDQLSQLERLRFENNWNLAQQGFGFDQALSDQAYGQQLGLKQSDFESAYQLADQGYGHQTGLANLQNSAEMARLLEQLRSNEKVSGEQNQTQLSLADRNNAAAMEQLLTQTGSNERIAAQQDLLQRDLAGEANALQEKLQTLAQQFQQAQADRDAGHAQALQAQIDAAQRQLADVNNTASMQQLMEQLRSNEGIASQQDLLQRDLAREANALQEKLQNLNNQFQMALTDRNAEHAQALQGQIDQAQRELAGINNAAAMQQVLAQTGSAERIASTQAGAQRYAADTGLQQARESNQTSRDINAANNQAQREEGDKNRAQQNEQFTISEENKVIGSASNIIAAAGSNTQNALAAAYANPDLTPDDRALLANQIMGINESVTGSAEAVINAVNPGILQQQNNNSSTAKPAETKPAPEVKPTPQEDTQKEQFLFMNIGGQKVPYRQVLR